MSLITLELNMPGMAFSPEQIIAGLRQFVVLTALDRLVAEEIHAAAPEKQIY